LGGRQYLLIFDGIKQKIMRTLYKTFILCLSLASVNAQTSLTTAVDFTVTDVHGNTHNLFNYLDNGKHVIIDFFFTTCGACQASVPTLNQAYTDYGCNLGEVIFIALDQGDTDSEVIQYENDFGGLIPSVSGNNGGGNAVIANYGISAYPTVVLIAPNRTILEQDIYPVNDITTALPNASINMASCETIISWDCVGNICYDPGNGLGMYTDQATCQAICGISAVQEHTYNNKKLLKAKDILGREWNCSFKSLPKGLYIINSEKVLKID
jgi:thiol-disulfide isomerase/thioredoxin